MILLFFKWFKKQSGEKGASSRSQGRTTKRQLEVLSIHSLWCVYMCEQKCNINTICVFWYSHSDGFQNFQSVFCDLRNTNILLQRFLVMLNNIASCKIFSFSEKQGLIPKAKNTVSAASKTNLTLRTFKK